MWKGCVHRAAWCGWWGVCVGTQCAQSPTVAFNVILNTLLQLGSLAQLFLADTVCACKVASPRSDQGLLEREWGC